MASFLPLGAVLSQPVLSQLTPLSSALSSALSSTRLELLARGALAFGRGRPIRPTRCAGRSVLERQRHVCYLLGRQRLRGCRALLEHAVARQPVRSHLWGGRGAVVSACTLGGGTPSRASRFARTVSMID